MLWLCGSVIETACCLSSLEVLRHGFLEVFLVRDRILNFFSSASQRVTLDWTFSLLEAVKVLMIAALDD